MSARSDDGTLRVLLGVTGSVAAIKIDQIANNIKSIESKDKKQGWARVEVKVVSTHHAQHFFEPRQLSRTVEALHFDEDEWQWKARGDSVLHIGNTSGTNESTVPE